MLAAPVAFVNPSWEPSGIVHAASMSLLLPSVLAPPTQGVTTASRKPQGQSRAGSSRATQPEEDDPRGDRPAHEEASVLRALLGGRHGPGGPETAWLPVSRSGPFRGLIGQAV